MVERFSFAEGLNIVSERGKRSNTDRARSSNLAHGTSYTASRFVLFVRRDEGKRGVSSLVRRSTQRSSNVERGSRRVIRQADKHREISRNAQFHIEGEPSSGKYACKSTMFVPGALVRARERS